MRVRHRHFFYLPPYRNGISTGHCACGAEMGFIKAPAGGSTPFVVRRPFRLHWRGEGFCPGNDGNGIICNDVPTDGSDRCYEHLTVAERQAIAIF